MGFLDRLRGQPASSSPAATATQQPFVDKAMGDEEVRRLRAELEKGHWEEPFQKVDQTRDWEDREFLAYTLTSFDGRPKWIEQLVKARPESGTAYLLKGRHSITWAWEARGGRKAETVTAQGWDLLHQRLMDAETELQKAAELDPEDPTPWGYQLYTTLGLEKGVQFGTGLLTEVRKRDPWNHPAMTSYLQLTTKKWGGNHELMFDFVRQITRDAPEGQSCYTLVAEAHIERWLYMASWEKQFDAADAYFRRPEVSNEIREAARRYLWSPQIKRTRRLPVDRQYFAFCFTEMQDWRAAKEQFDQVGPGISQLPWAYLGDGAAAFTRFRQRAMKGSGAG